MFKTSILNEVTGYGVEKAQREAGEAKAYLWQVIAQEVFSPAVRDLIFEAAGDYALARQRIMEAKVGEDAHQYVVSSMRHDREFITLLLQPDSPESKAIRERNQAEFEEIRKGLQDA